jgi:excinuclease UvrABC nuclease subunit
MLLEVRVRDLLDEGTRYDTPADFLNDTHSSVMGIYGFVRAGQFLYIGKAKDLRNRVLSHLKGQHGYKTAKRITSMLLKGALGIVVCQVDNPLELMVSEHVNIKRHHPILNVKKI